MSSFENTAKVLHKRLLSDWIYLKKRASLSDKICDQQDQQLCAHEASRNLDEKKTYIKTNTGNHFSRDLE